MVMSPMSVKLEIEAMTRRMIFPERVLGMSLTIHTFLGRADLPDLGLDRGDDLVLDVLARRDPGI